MRALTANETAILKSRFQAGASGHKQKVVLTKQVASTAIGIVDPYFPWVQKLTSGQAGVLMRARATAVSPFRVYFLRYIGQHVLAAAIELFSYDTSAFGLVTYRGALLAACWDPTTLAVRYRSSGDGGITWTAEATLIPGVTYPATEVSKNGGHNTVPCFQIATSKDELTLFVFNCAVFSAGIAGSSTLRYRKTAALDVATGWTALAETGAPLPSVGRNYGGTTARNQGVQRGFIVCETKTAGTWVAAMEADDGDWHANHMVTRGTIGGAWVRVLLVGYGGGLSGGQGANGGVFRDRNSDLIFYVMSDNGDDATTHRSLDSGSTWDAARQEMPAGGTVDNPYIGGGSGATIPIYDSQEYIWGHVAGGGVAVGVSHLGDGALIKDWNRVFGAGMSATYATYTPQTTDVSDRVLSISLQKDDDADAASFNIELRNNDGALNLGDSAASLNAYVQPNVKVEVWQWHGAATNTVKTFTGLIDNAQERADSQRTTLVGRDMAKKLLLQTVRPIAPQELSDAGYIRDMGNYVYLNKTIAEVLNDLLAKAALEPSTSVWSTSSYVFKELVLTSGSLMEAAKHAAIAAGLRLWADEDGVFRTAPVAGPQPASAWTYSAKEDLVGFDADLSDDQTFTRVRVIGKANIGAKYLKEQFIWPGLGSPAGIEYDPTTGHLWYLDQNSDLYRLDPKANMAVAAGPFAIGLAWPDGITVDPADNHLWVSDGFNSSVGNNVNRKYKKLDRNNLTGAPLLGPFTNPDGDHCGIHAYDSGGGVTRLYLTTFTSGQLVRMNTNGTEDSRVPSQAVNPTAITSDGQGGYLLSAWESVDLYQIDFAGSTVNNIKQPAKNATELGYDSSDGGVYQVFGPANTIVKYAVAGTPTGVATATLAEAIDADLERQLGGEVRVFDLIDRNVSDNAMAYSTAVRTLARVRQYTKRVSAGAIGSPGLQLHDRITVTAPSVQIASGDYMVRSIRSDQTAEGGTYLMTLLVEPYAAAY